MKILYIAQYFNTPKMKGATRHFEIAHYLLEAGHEVYLVASNKDTRLGFKARWKYEIEYGLHVYRYPVPFANKMNYLKKIVCFIIFGIQSALKARSIQCDVILATSTPLTIAVPAIAAMVRQKAPMVFEVRDLWPELPVAIGAIKNPVLIKMAQWLERQAYFHATRIIALSPGMKDGVVKTGYAEEKIEIISNMSQCRRFDVDSSSGAEFRKQYGIPEDAVLILYAGTLGEINGVSYIVELACEMRKFDSSIIFFVLGEGRDEGLIKRNAIAAGVAEKNLFIRPRIEKEQIPYAFNAATLTCSFFINLREMWSNSANKFFDSLAAGRPIILNYRGWQAEIIDKHDAGIVIPNNDADSATQKIWNKIKQPNWLDQAGKKARRVAVEQFDRDTLVKKVEHTLIKARQEGMATEKLIV
ncbi:MAG: glycosyltransferase [Chitinivibrionales bacterium]|nr:glycosyltransferase [Chitinivibrionales bacterium]